MHWNPMFSCALAPFIEENTLVELKKDFCEELADAVSLGLIDITHHSTLPFRKIGRTNILDLHEYCDDSHVMLRTEGMVIDEQNNIVQNPFSYIFSYLENGEGNVIESNDIFECIDDIPGQLLYISQYPGSSELLMTTPTSFEIGSEIMIDELIHEIQKRNIFQYTAINLETLILKVVGHNESDLSSKYLPGIYLLGARKNSFDDYLFEDLHCHRSEKELDLLAKKLGFLRPDWKVMRFNQVQELASEGTRYILRNENSLIKI